MQMFVVHLSLYVHGLYVCCRSALKALGISGRSSAQILTAFLSGESFTPGSHTGGVSERPISA